MAEATAPLASRSPQSITVDNLLRRELRIADPGDPAQIAQGLLSRYPDTLDQMRREREGINYGAPDTWVQPGGGSTGATATELALAQDDLERDIATLTHSSELKDIQVELKGWGRAARQAASDGLAAGAMALDITQNDRAMAARRVLGDYARLSRYVGAMSASAGPCFRRFAQSCDVIGAMILVAIGDGLAARGITRGTALIRVAASELQTRRNAVIQALRTITGSASAPLGQDEYPRGLEAYRILVRQLELAGQSDLRTLLDEASLAVTLDQLVDLAVGATADGLRELTTTSAIVVDRLKRLISHCRAFDLPIGGLPTRSTPDSPPMAYFASALQMFVDAFATTSGGRLLFVARPPILAYGLYGRAGPNDPTLNLIQLTLARSALAEQADCAACCSCDEASVRREVLIDYLLYRIDRAIDLYAVGYVADGYAEPEQRAAAAAFTIETAQDRLLRIPPALPPQLDGARDLLLPAVSDPRSRKVKKLLQNELSAHYVSEQRLEDLVRQLSPACHENIFGESKSGASNNVRDILRATAEQFGGILEPGTIVIPPDPASSIAGLAFGWPARAQATGATL